MKNKSIALALKNVKLAALYFDDIIAKGYSSLLDSNEHLEQLAVGSNLFLAEYRMKQLYPDGWDIQDLRDAASYTSALSDSLRASFCEKNKLDPSKPISSSEIYTDDHGRIDDEDIDAYNEIDLSIDAKYEEFKNENFNNTEWLIRVIDEMGFTIEAILGGSYSVPNYNDAVGVQLSNLSVIDESTLTWEQVIEMREDPETLNDIKRFKNFAIDRLQGLSAREAEDLIMQMEYDYKKRAKEWGVDTLISSGQLLVSHKNTAAIIALLSTAFAGIPLNIAIATSAAASLGAIELNIISRKRRLMALENSDPIRFIIKANGN